MIIAAGEEIEVSFLPKGLEKREGIVLTQRDGSTGIKGVFAGGDVTSNQRTVAHAIGSGKKAALAIDCYLKGKDTEEAIRQILIGEGPSLSIFRQLHPEARPMNAHVVTLEELNTFYFEPYKRLRESNGPGKKRVKGFGEVTSTFTEGFALEEAERCFSCGTCLHGRCFGAGRWHSLRFVGKGLCALRARQSGKVGVLIRRTRGHNSQWSREQTHYSETC